MCKKLLNVLDYIHITRLGCGLLVGVTDADADQRFVALAESQRLAERSAYGLVEERANGACHTYRTQAQRLSRQHYITCHQTAVNLREHTGLVADEDNGRSVAEHILERGVAIH